MSSMNRRKFLLAGSAALSGIATFAERARARLPARPSAPAAEHRGEQRPPPPAQRRPRAASIVTPNGRSLPWRMVDGVKVFHLIAEPVRHVFADGLEAECWGYNGTTPGPTIEAFEGERVRIFVTNRLPEGTSVHWHGMLVPNGMDGVAGLNQRKIEPHETFVYEFRVPHEGTFMYHPHFDEMVQMGMGLMGMFIVHPRVPRRPPPDRDFVILLTEWNVPVGTARPNPSAVDFNLFTFNGAAFPSTEALVVKLGDRVRIRFGNLSALDNHPIHLHGMRFRVTATDGGRIPESAQWPETTVLVPIGTTRDIEFVADNPGDWALHCHMTHHIMNQMAHRFPNMLGVNARALDRRVQPLVRGYMTMTADGMGEMGESDMPQPDNSIPMAGGQGQFGLIDMGGMMTVLKVREGITSYEDPGWYAMPPGTLAHAADDALLRANGITPPAAEDS